MESLVNSALRRAAEAEMRRTLPEADGPPAKKAKRHDQETKQPIAVGRVDYTATNELAGGLVGFVVSSSYRREMSAAREAIDLLYPQLTQLSASAQGEASSGTESQASSPLISSFKIGTRGVICLRLSPALTPAANTTPGMAAQQAALRVHQAVNEGELPPVRYLHRIVPIVSTCPLEIDELRSCASRLAPIAAAILEIAPRRTFGISLHNRDHGEVARANNPEKVANHLPSRKEIISAVAQGLAAELKASHAINATVDLTSPSMVVQVEVLPVMGALFAGIAVLPQHVCSLKPKLTMRSLQQRCAGS